MGDDLGYLLLFSMMGLSCGITYLLLEHIKELEDGE